MRTVIGYTASVLILLVAGIALWTTGRIEQRLVDAHKQLLTLQYDAPLAEYDRVERSVRPAGGLPWIAKLVAGLREQRATSEYWRRDYQALARGPGDADTAAQDPVILLLAANAAFRRVRLDGGDRAAVDRLQEILRQYSDLLKRDPEAFDVAYNYELVARTRDRLARAAAGRTDAGRDSRAAAKPSGQTIHGRPGAPATDADLSDFKIIIPRTGDERRQQPDAGTGGAKVRKG